MRSLDETGSKGSLMNAFVPVNVLEITDNPFNIIGKEWMLVTAGENNIYNTMTASWGAFGVLWNKNTATIFVRPSRLTYSFIEKYKYFTLSFFEENYREILNFCGANSGRNTDKAGKTGLTPFSTLNSIAFKEARLIIECKKIYSADLIPKNILQAGIAESNYPVKDYHRIYIGEIVSCLKRKQEV